MSTHTTTDAMSELELLDGETAVYPGHPLTVAYLIIHLYPSLAKATCTSDRSQYMDALSNRNVPGAGGNVYAALDFLKRAAHGEGSMQDAIAHANRSWANCDGQAIGNIERWRHGQSQADRILPRLTNKLLSWPLD